MEFWKIIARLFIQDYNYLFENTLFYSDTEFIEIDRLLLIRGGPRDKLKVVIHKRMD